MSSESSEQKPNLPPFQTVDEACRHLVTQYETSEMHGLICGLLAGGAKIDEDTFFTQLTKANTTEHLTLLKQIYKVTQAQMRTMTFDFQMLLPDDSSPLPLRAEALGLWCQGFSEGVLQAGMLIDDMKDEEARDALYHITEIAKIDYEYTEVNEEDEKAYVEVAEYVRMAVLMINTGTHSSGSIVASSSTIH